MDLSQVVQAIYEVKTQRELDSVFEACRGRLRELRGQEDSVAKLKFKVGDKVKFNARRRGIPEGEIVKMNPAKAKVKVESGMTWNVPYTMLEKVG